MNKCLIVSGGEYAPICEKERYGLVIACDRGYENCRRAGIVPDIMIGDLDSYGGSVGEETKLIKLEPVKDDTDTISAVKYALKEGYRDITVCCAFGGRLDHTVANIQTAAYIAENGARAAVTGRGEELYAVKDGSLRLAKKENCYLSVFSFSDVCGGVTIKGAKYELCDSKLTNTFPIGVSNEWAKVEAEISVKNGTLIVIVSENKSAE